MKYVPQITKRFLHVSLAVNCDKHIDRFSRIFFFQLNDLFNPDYTKPYIYLTMYFTHSIKLNKYLSSYTCHMTKR